MSNYDQLTHISATVEQSELAKTKMEKKTFKDYFALAVATFGVGYIPLAPGTWGSAVGILIYLAVRQIEIQLFPQFSNQFFAVNLLLLMAFCAIGIWASTQTARILGKKDPQKVVVDEVMGQLITLGFVPLVISWQFVLGGFLLFRLFDIWKPYPIKTLEILPNGLGICADDILAGVYAGGCLAIIYAISLM